MAQIVIDIPTAIERDVIDIGEIVKRVARLIVSDSTVTTTIYPYDRDDARSKALAHEVVADYADNLTEDEAELFEQNVKAFMDLISEAAAAGLNNKGRTLARV